MIFFNYTPLPPIKILCTCWPGRRCSPWALFPISRLVSKADVLSFLNLGVFKTCMFYYTEKKKWYEEDSISGASEWNLKHTGTYNYLNRFKSKRSSSNLRLKHPCFDWEHGLKSLSGRLYQHNKLHAMGPFRPTSTIIRNFNKQRLENLGNQFGLYFCRQHFISVTFF